MPDKEFWNEIISALDPELRELATRIAASIPEKSLLRSRIGERILGILKSMAERRAKKVGPLAGALVEKATDIFDFATPVLFGKGEGPSPAALRGWMQGFFNEAAKRMSRARDPQWMFNRLQQEFELRRQILKMIEQAAKEEVEAAKAEERPSPSVDWPEEFKKLLQEVELLWHRFRSFVEPKLPAIKAGLVEADWQAAERVFWTREKFHDWRLRQRWIRGSRRRRL